MIDGTGLRQLADNMFAFADNIEATVNAALLEVANAAAAELRTTLPKDTGATRQSVEVAQEGNVTTLTIGTDYASFIFSSGDDLRTPVYPALLAAAFANAVNEVGIVAQVVDMTEAYFGQGRTTSDVTGSSRKMIKHAPPHEAEAWRRNHPELITRIVVEGEEVELVPADTIAAGQFGTVTFSPGV